MEHTSAAPISGSAQRLLSFRSSVANPTVKLLWCLSFTPIPFKSQWREGENSQVLTTSKRTNKNPLPWNPFQSLHFIFLSSREEGIYFTTLWVNKYWLDVFFFSFWNWRSRDTTRFLISSYSNMSKYSLSAAAPVWRALPYAIIIEVGREQECADVKKCVCWKERSLLALKQICTHSVNVVCQNFSVKTGCVSALCVNNSRGVSGNRVLFCSKWHRLRFSWCR